MSEQLAKMAQQQQMIRQALQDINNKMNKDGQGKLGDLEKIMKEVGSSKIGLIWDISNMWTVRGEVPSIVYPVLKKYIRHVHVKDAIKEEGKLRYTFLGKGQVPVFEGIDLLARDKYKGYYSFEWEKLWHPEIAEPELALADYPKAMKAHFV